MEYKDYYKILGVERDASADDIRRAYRKLARKYHPDVSKEPDAEDRFKDASEAYEVLKDPEKRAAYDQIQPNAASGRGFTPPPDWDSGFEFSRSSFTGADASSFSDFFSSLFGQGGFAGPANARGQDHVSRLALNLEDAFTGGQRTITLRLPEADANGQVVNRARNIKVNIPKGVRAGQQLRLAGQGSPGAGGGDAGDLYLEITFRPHPYYRLEGNDLILDLPVAPWEAALGATVKAPTPNGAVDLKIPPNSREGRRLRLKGRGMPGKTPGDLYAVLRIALPPADDEQSRALYQKMAETLSFNPRKHLGV